MPKSFAQVKAGTSVPVDGVAWSQGRGIKAVEVRVDGGDWQPARLANVDTWRQWVKTLATPQGAETLQTELTYHVVPEQKLPTDIAGQTLESVQGGSVKVSGSGDNLKVEVANVVCGGVKTADATVYLIDTVLMPKM